MPFDPHLADRLRAALAGRQGIVEKKMFGGWIELAARYLKTLAPK
jgi:hypothetical protein